MTRCTSAEELVSSYLVISARVRRSGCGWPEGVVMTVRMMPETMAEKRMMGRIMAHPVHRAAGGRASFVSICTITEQSL